MEEGGRGIMPTVVNEEELTGVTDGVVEEDDNEMAMAREVEREGTVAVDNGDGDGPLPSVVEDGEVVVDDGLLGAELSPEVVGNDEVTSDDSNTKDVKHDEGGEQVAVVTQEERVEATVK